MRRLYSLGVQLLGIAYRLASPFHPKAKKWVRGRKNWEPELRNAIDPNRDWIWFHCASLGEFEQGRNLLERIREERPDYCILLTFFSPSGYEVRKDYPHADHVAYLPLDSPTNARRFFEIVRPKLGVFVKYDFWLNFIAEAERRDIPLILISARVQRDSSYFRGAASGLYRRAFLSFRLLFTQDEESQAVFGDLVGHPDVHCTGDTRFDRVEANRREFEPIPELEKFKGEGLCLVCGSSWPEDEKVIFEALDTQLEDRDFRLIIAPHEIHAQAIAKGTARYPDRSIRWSEIDKLGDRHRILWIDSIGLLSRLYHYADLAYVGGAWGQGLHNILEPATFGAPVIFGPETEGFPEAGELIARGGAFSIKNRRELKDLVIRLLTDRSSRIAAGSAARQYIEQGSGATDSVWLTLEAAGLI